MKIKIIFFLLFISFKLFAQVGINEDNPLTTLHISSKDPNSPKINEGVIIPIVKSLNIDTQDAKQIGLLVFLDNEDQNTVYIEKGFYWWNGTEWIPFFSMNKLTSDQTVTYMSSLNSFKEGDLTSDGNSNIRTISFNPSSLKANDTSNFEIVNGDLIVKKAGTYHIQATVSLNSYTSSANQARDAYEAVILKNGVEPSPNLRTAYGFPNGQDTFNSNTVISGYLKLNVNDVISIQINRYYRKTNTTVVIKPNGSMTDLTLRYLGNF